MLVRVNNTLIPADVICLPVMNFGQFHSDDQIGKYEMEFSRTEFVNRMDTVYRECVAELKTDDRIYPDAAESCPFRTAGYPPLQELLDQPAVFLAAIYFFQDELFADFLRWRPGDPAQFMINSIDAASATSASVIIRGRGYEMPLKPLEQYDRLLTRIKNRFGSLFGRRTEAISYSKKSRPK
jgi:hypothetical protein